MLKVFERVEANDNGQRNNNEAIFTHGPPGMGKTALVEKNLLLKEKKIESSSDVHWGRAKSEETTTEVVTPFETIGSLMESLLIPSCLTKTLRQIYELCKYVIIVLSFMPF